jgi:hypothetical protein
LGFGQAEWRGTEALRPCGSATTPRSSAAAEGGQAAVSNMARDLDWAVYDMPVVQRGDGGEPSGAVSGRRGHGEANKRSRPSRQETLRDRYWRSRAILMKATMQNLRQQHRRPGKEVRTLERASSQLKGSVCPIGGQ